MVKFAVLLTATLLANTFAYPTVEKKSPVASPGTRIVRAAYANPQHYDRVHCLPHEDHVDCHIDHYDGYTNYNGYIPDVTPHVLPPTYPPTRPQSGNSYADATAKSFAINTPLGGISFSDANAHSRTSSGGILGGLLE